MNLHLILTLLGAMIAIHLIGRMLGIKILPLGMFLSEDLDVPSKEGRSISRAMLGGVIIYNGALVVLDSSGWAKPGVTATGLIAAGVADQQIDNTDGGNGDLSVVVKRGISRLLNSADADLITQAEIGDACYIVDDETVAKTSGGNTRSVAGEIVDVDDNGVWVDIPSAKIALGGNLLASNNLNEVTPATARANIGANLLALELNITSLVGTGVFRVAAPVGGVITKIKSVLEGHALTTGDATLTAKIGSTPVTTGVITITEAGSAIGDEDSCAPSAARTVTEDGVISITVGGTNDNASATARVVILIAY
jgi:hypothetical protein